MSWLPIIALALAAYATLHFALRIPRGAREAVGAAIALGVAGYALQGSPGLQGAPKAFEEKASIGGEFVVEQRRAFFTDLGPSERWLVVSDAMMRQGEFEQAANILRGAVRANPTDAESWLALGNALILHESGALSPAALFALRRSAQIAPDSPGAPYFLGLSLAQSGRFGEARQMWAEILGKAPTDAKWRPVLARQLMGLDSLIAAESTQRPVTDGQGRQ